MKRRRFLSLSMLAGWSGPALPRAAAVITDAAPFPVGAVPNRRQLRWHALEAYAFVHFGMNTFTDREWGYGDDAPATFNPSGFDALQIAATARQAGLRGVILTAKHHDGFCLWPSAHTDYSIRSSPFQDGKGDLVRDMAQACRAQGLAFGLYLSPWDRHRADYGTPAYLAYFRAQLRELLTGYGEIFEMWFDGANGGDGYYGGAREVRHIDPASYYDWPETWRMVHELQPNTAVWGTAGSDLRWVGNEAGYAGEPCWATMDAPTAHGAGFDPDKNLHGVRGGSVWRPAEVDVSIRPGWFWHAREDDQVKSVARLTRIYLASVGRGAGLLLNLAPDRGGRIPEHDAAELRDWGALLRTTLARNLAGGAQATASNQRGGDARYAPSQVLADGQEHYWTTDDAVREAQLELRLDGVRRFNLLRLREYLPLGQRIDEFALDVWQAQGWLEVARGSSIGSQRLLRLEQPVSAARLRLRILSAQASPALTELALFLLPELLDAPAVTRDRAGRVRITAAAAGQTLYVSTDGGIASAASPEYRQPFALPQGGVVSVLACKDGAVSARARAAFDLSSAAWRIHDASAAGAQRLIDGDPSTIWRSAGATHQVTLDLGARHVLTGCTVLPAVPPPSGAGLPLAYQCYLSTDGRHWSDCAASGEFSNIEANPVLQTIAFTPPRQARYLRLCITRVSGAQQQLALAELAVLTR